MSRNREVSIFTHSGTDGPITYDTPNDPLLNDKKKQMHIDGWSSIDFNWATYKGVTTTRCVFFGCRSALKTNSFAKKISALSNYSTVEVIGQSTSSFPSFYPDSRYTTLARSMNQGWNAGPTYMVSGNEGEGKAALTNKIKANKMSFYKGTKDNSKSYQAIFNDHRTTRTKNSSSELNTINRWLRLYS